MEHSGGESKPKPGQWYRQWKSKWHLLDKEIIPTGVI
jgi:hypothetical protein